MVQDIEKLIKEKLLMGHSNLDEALNSSEVMSQTEAILRMLSGKNIFLSGSAGTGKTTVIKTYLEILELLYGNKFKVGITATTGLAATLLGGKTLHSTLGISLDNSPFIPSEDSFLRGGYDISNIKKLDVLIVDEVSMLSADLLIKINEMMKYAKDSKKIFGGIQVIFSGDFLQLPPIVKKDTMISGKKFAFETDVWEEANFEYCFLDKSYRTEDEELKSVLEGIRNKDTINIEEKLNERKLKAPKGISTLFTKNMDVDAYNKKCQDNNPNTLFTLDMYVIKGNVDNVEDLIKQNRIEKELKLKVGDVVMVTNNVESKFIYNGLIGTIEDFLEDEIVIKSHKGEVFYVPQVTFKKEKKEWDTIEEDFYNKRKKKWETTVIHQATTKILSEVKQYPIRLAYAITVHKSQGQTFDGISVDLRNCFSDGLGYVALSRARSLDSVYIKDYDYTAFRVNQQCKEFMDKVRFIKTEFDVEDFYNNFIEKMKLKGIPFIWDGTTVRTKNKLTVKSKVKLPKELTHLENAILEFSNAQSLDEVQNLAKIINLLKNTLKGS